MTYEKMTSETVTVEIGQFKRTTKRKGKKRHVRTVRFQKNPKKIVLARINGLELYVLPYEYADSVFIGQFPNFTMALDKYQIPKLIVFFNKARWFLNGEWQKTVCFTKQAQNDSALCEKGFNLGLEQLKNNQNQHQKVGWTTQKNMKPKFWSRKPQKRILFTKQAQTQPTLCEKEFNLGLEQPKDNQNEVQKGNYNYYYC